MSHEEAEKRGDFSVKEFQILFYNQTINHEIGVVKNIQKRMLFGILVPYSPDSGSLSRIRFIASSISDCASAEIRENS